MKQRLPRTIALAVRDWPGHIAGQHVDVRLTAPDGYSAVRSYSIASGLRTRMGASKSPSSDWRTAKSSPYLDRRNSWSAMIWNCEARLAAGSCGAETKRSRFSSWQGGSGIVPPHGHDSFALASVGSTAPFRLLYSVKGSREQFFTGMNCGRYLIGTIL